MSSPISSEPDHWGEMLRKHGIDPSRTLSRPRRCNEPPQYRTEPTQYGWTDEMCLTEGQRCCVWKKIPENEMRGHLINFVNMWFGGPKDEKNTCSIVRNMLLMTPLGMSNDLLLRNVFDAAIETAEAPKAVDSEKSTIEEPVVDNFDPKYKSKVLPFHKWLKEHFALLKEAEKKTPRGQPRCAEYDLISQKLRAVLGFCALVLMRIMTKNELQMKRYFPDPATKTFERLFRNVGLSVSLIAPTPKFLESAAFGLSNNSYNKGAIDLLHLLIFQYLKSTTQDDQSSRLTRQILEEGCLNAMEGNGIGLVTMFRDVGLLYPNIEQRKLLSIIAVHARDTEASRRLIKFLDIYAQPEKPQYSWKWARILAPNYFSDLNIKENKLLCSKFAALLVDENPGIFGHKDLKPGSMFHNIAIQWVVSGKKELEKENGILNGEDIC